MCACVIAYFEPHPSLYCSPLSALAVCAAQSSPSFPQGTYSAIINQNAVADDAIITVACLPESDTTLEYTITASDPAEVAAIDAFTGVVSLIVNSIDLVGNYTVSLRCQNSAGESSNALLEIMRVEENEYSPQFMVEEATVDIVESRDIDTDPFVVQLNATDEDLGTFGSIIYSLEGTQSAGFTIHRDTGRITLTDNLDYETNTVHLFLVRASNPATDSGDVVSSAVSLEVNVIDINDESPMFIFDNSNDSSYSAIVQETTATTPRPDPGFLIVTCTDVDSDDSNITYATLSDSGPFHLDTVTGSFSLTEDLDYETTTAYSFTVGCWDNGTPNLTSSVDVDVVVGSVNEGHPVLISPSIVPVITEGAPAGTEIAMYSATDVDDGPDGYITYTLTSEGLQFLDVDLTSGVVFVSGPEELDFELLDLNSVADTFFRYEFAITACDRHPPSSECTVKNEVVFVFGVNEDPPEFTEEIYTVSYPENTPAGTTITTAMCSDNDRGTGRFCGIKFEENVGLVVTNTFIIDKDTGEIVSKDILDYETETTYAFEVVCYDSGNNGVCGMTSGGAGEMSQRARIDVIVEPLNDNQPRFTQSVFEFNVSRTTPDDRRTIGIASAIDADIDEGGELDYTLQANGYFDITDEGQVQIFNSVFNYSDSFISITVDVTDGGDNDTALIVIHLTDGNLNSPEFISGPQAIIVSELSPVGTSVISLTCEDEDADINGDIRYSITEGNTDNSFRVDEITGEITVNNILILPQNTSDEDYVLTITCEDRGVPVFSDVAGVFIHVYKDDSLPPSFPNDTVIAFISEDAELNDLVTTVEAIDLDSEELRYRFDEVLSPMVFTIGISTGEVIVSAPLDREITSMYTLTVIATEERQIPGPERSDNTTLIIYIRDVNDNTPTCNPNSPVITIEETLAIGSIILELNCIDIDAVENGAISYSLTNDFGVLAINSDGIVTLNESLSETDQNTLVVNILVSDQGSEPNEHTVIATIFISSVNRHMPTFTNIPATIEVSEAQLIQTVFFSIEAEDPDRGSFGEVTYAIVNSTTNDDIGIFSNTGGLYLNRKLDFFDQNEYILNISAADSDFTIYGQLIIDVTDANEFSPECEQSSITIQIQEGLPAGQMLTPSLSCTDDDLGSNGDIVFSIVSGDEDGTFEILLDGSLRTLQVLDYDNGPQRYDMIVNVSDSGSPAQFEEVNVAVVVQAVNEHTPEIDSAPYLADVMENSRIGSSVLQLIASDGDSSEHPHGQLNYLIQGLSNPVFQFTSSGELQVAGEIDREEESTYNFTVTVSDQGTPPLSTETSITITVTDLDDNSPEFTEDIYVAVLNGTAEQGSHVVTVECIDEDEGTNAGLEYRLVSGEDAQFFSIDVNGMIIVDDDLSVSDTYSIFVTCIGTGPGNFSDTAVVSIQVLVDSNITFHPTSTYSISVPENISVGTELLEVLASSSTGAQLFFDLVDSTNPFAIGETSGIVQSRGVLDYETKRTYTLQVRASDNGSPPNFGDAVIQVAVINVNDETPVITTEPSTIAISEGDGVTQPMTIAEYECTDEDDGVFGDVTFEILSGNSDSLFSLSTSGTLQLISSLDYEVTQSHTLEVICKDGGQPPNTDSITVSISVIPANDHSPVFPSDTLDIAITENLPATSQVGNPVEAIDADLPPHGDIRYSIVSGNDPRIFAISSETGQLSLVQNLDYESTILYSIIILAQDSGGQVEPEWIVLNDTITVTVTVLDYNDNSPHFEHDTYSGTISETAQNGDQVMFEQEISCSDRDSGDNGQISLSILEESPFTVENTGIVLVSMSHLLDFEIQQLYILTIVCLDNGTPQQMNTVDLVITVQDINEFGPEFNVSSYTFNVLESTMVGRSIGEVFASDLDAGDAGTIQYSIITQDIPFDIDSVSGEIILANTLDYETQQTSYVMQVVAADMSLLSDTATVIVTVVNEDDNVPTFTQTVYYLEVRENAPVDTSVGEISCTDADDMADNLPISYHLGANVPFSLDENGRLTVTSGLNLELTPRYTFRVNCNDSAQNTVQTTLSINILPFNDFPPVLQDNLPYTVSIAENPSIGTAVFTVEALDDDQGSYNEITYSFSEGNEAGRFSIDSDSGQVTTAEFIDREVEDEYVLSVVARNDIPSDDESGSPSLSATTTLTVTVTDINDNTPSIAPNNVTVVLQVSVSANISVVELECTDPDAGLNGETTLSITSDQFSERFELTETGILRTTDVIEEDVVVVVTCTDSGIPQRSSSVRVVIETISMNEHDPVFNGPSLQTIEVREDTVIGEEVMCFTATDADGPDSPDGLLEYTITAESNDDRFNIKRSTGCIFVALALDYDETNFYEYTLTVEDMGDPTRSASITVHITILDTVQDPPIVQGTYSRSLLEGLGGGTHIVDFLCEDSDDQDVVTYSITAGNSEGLFEIDAVSGRIEVSGGQILDYETNTAHIIMVQCIDTYNLTDSANVFITIIPVNEFTPSFESAEYNVPEHSIGGTVVANLQWEDLDNGRDGEVDFAIISGDSQMLFEITSNGQLLVRGTLDREIDDEFNLEIMISDQSDTDIRSSNNDVTVILTDINDNRPLFDREVYNFDPLEGDEGFGYFIGSVFCSDNDLGFNADTNYDVSSTSSDANLFSVNSTGDITLVGNLGDRVFDNITFFVQCRDSGSIPMFGTALVIVVVNEENLFPPIFSPAVYSTVVPEDTPILSQILVNVSASDRDEGVNGRVRYSLEDDFDNTFFIDYTSGELSLLRSLDFEETTFYNLIALATDGTPDSEVRMIGTASITINVTGVNEFTPYCSDPIYVTIINKTTSGSIVDLACIDDDSGIDGELSYIITSGNEGDLFTLSTGGVVSIPTAIEPNDEIEQYPLYINVTDTGDPNRVTQVEVIAIYSFDNLDDPDFNQTHYCILVDEGTDVGVVVATLTAEDSDPSLQGELVYSLEGVTQFRIDSGNGQLFLSSPLDYEEETELNFTVIAYDSDPYAPMSGTAQVTVLVRNENDNSPRCSKQLYSTSILSTQSTGQTILTLNCSDLDDDPITYSIITSQSTFIIHATSGEVSIVGSLTAGTTNIIDVLVTDGLRSIDVSVSVGVRFSNTAPPIFTLSHFNFTVSEETALLVTIGTLYATDEDSTELTFSAVNSDLAEFYITPRSGDILLTVPLDYEQITSYQFQVMVSDEGSYDGTNILTDIATVTISINNTNDNLPQFSNDGIYGAIVSKSTPVNSDVVEISCTDRDLPPYGSPEVTSSLSNSPFALIREESDYTIRLTEPLLDSVSASYIINITCTDGGGKSVDGQVFIFVPEPDAPTFSETIYEWILSENTPTGAEFVDVMATSSDMSDVTYDIADGNRDDLFYIDPSSGVVSLVGSLDYETQQTHGLIVRARDGQNRESRVLLLIQVSDVNDQVPLTPPSARLEILQNSPVSTPVGTLECSDGETEDGTGFNFTFIPASELFSVDEYGVVRLEGELDATPVHVIPVICSEVDMPEAVSTGVVTVEVIFVNENTPQFDFSSYIFSISEAVNTLTYVGTVEALDSDVGSFGEISYSILDGNQDKFYIEATSGRIGVLTSLDREMTDTYNLTIIAVDGGASAQDSTRKTGTTLVEIQIEDANDNTPTSTMSSYIESILTDHTVHSPVLSVVCSDPDQGAAGTVDYFLDPITVPFSVQSNGTIILDEHQPDQTVHTFDVVCSDRGTPSLSSSALVTVLITAVELEAPMFDSTSYNITVSENEPIRTTILRVHATPSDSSVAIGYQLESGNDGEHFQVDPSTGDVIIRNPLDASQQQYYTLTIRATNTGRNPLSSFTTVDIVVTDINDNSPIFSTPFYAASINETVPLLTPVVQVYCSDEDITADISYSITEGHGDVFNITQGGLVVTSGSIDYELKTVYNLVVMCSDGGATPRSTEATVRVEIEPVNEFLPLFVQEQYTFTALENSFGSEIGIIQAYDNDDGFQGDITYLLQDPGNFYVIFVDPSTGEVLVANNLDYEVQAFWNLTVIARDGAGAESFVPLLIIVSNINDVIPVVTPATSVATIPHNTPPGYPVQSYTCSDGDLSQTSLAITNGNDLGFFYLNTASSQLIWNGTALASDLLASIVVSLSLECVDVEASNVQSVLAYIAVTIQVGNVLPPQFTSDTYAREVLEDTVVGTSLLNVSAVGEDGNNIEYSLDELFHSLPFRVDPLTGAVILTSTLNRENSSQYVFPVYARDVITDTFGVTLVAITVVDVNDNQPIIIPDIQVLSLPENMGLNLPFTMFQCMDDDSGENGATIFSLIPQDTFSITQSGQVLLSRPLNFEAESQYNITVICSDQGIPPSSVMATLFIEVIGTNEHYPMFSLDMYTFIMSEGEIVGTLVGVVLATDGDNDQLQYDIVGGSGRPYFTVNSLGEIQTTSLPTNATQSTSLDLVVEVSDGFLSTTAVVVVNISDINEPPQFPYSGVLALWSTSAPIGDTIIEIVCYDTDTPSNAQLDLILHTNPSSLPLEFTTLGSYSVIVGGVAANNSISAGTYIFSLMCTDGILSTTADITLRVEGVNNPPQFDHGDLSFSIPEQTAIGTPLVNIIANDPEGTTITYSIASGTGLGTFEIDQITGQISLALSLDYEVTSDYQFTVTATDSSRFDRTSNTVSVFVYVQNINDVPPILSPTGSIILTLLEDSPPGTQVTTFQCIDPEGSLTTLTLTPEFNAINSPFTISDSVISLQGEIDYERETEYNIIVTCIDAIFTGGDETFQQSATLIIHITPVNIFSPIFISPLMFDVSEDTEVGSVVGRVEAIDYDYRVGPVISYTLLTHLDTFVLGSVSGVINLRSELDFESVTSYTLSIEASDNDFTEDSVTMNTNITDITIIVIDTNDNRPTCVQHLVNVVILTGLYNDLYLAQLLCSDIDSQENGILVYSFMEDTLPTFDNGQLLLNSSTGQMTFTGSLTEVQTVVIDVIVSDSGQPPKIAIVTLTLQIQSNNLTEPRFNISTFERTIPEDIPVNTIILPGFILMSSLYNPNDDPVTFKLRDNPLYGRVFIINSATGDISVTSESPLDYDEGLKEYNLIVEASVGMFTPTAIVSVFLIDVNDNPPRFELATYLGAVLENKPVGTLVATVTAIDIDSGLNQDFIYFIENSINFQVDANTGEITTLTLLDREALPMDSITVTAIDSGSPPLSSTTVVSVTINDENDVRPQFLQDLYIININNVSPPGTQLLTLTVNDEDIVGEFAFRIVANASESDVFDLFTVLSPEGILVQRSVDIPSNHRLLYRFMVEVNDGIHIETTDVIINIVTVTTATLHILENQPHAFDLKRFLRERGFNFASESAIFSFLSGNELMDFTISSNGTLTTLGLDREFNSMYSLNINVTDPFSGEVANVLVNIVVEDVNDHSPIFPGDYEYFINETTYVSSTYLGKVEATDQDDPTTRNARLQYTLLVPNQDGFSITTDGELYVMGTFDRENRDQYVFIVRAEDFGEPDQEYGYGKVIVNIVDTNDNNPQFFPSDVVEFFVEIEISDKVLVGPDSVLDDIIAVLPVVNITIDLDYFIFFDPDETSVLTVTLIVVSGANKFKLESSQDTGGIDMMYSLIATDVIKPEDHGTILQIILSDELKEENPVIRNVTILVTELTEPAETPTGTGDSPTTKGLSTPTTTNFFTTEIGIAVIVVMALLGLAIVLLFVCLIFYCIVKYRRSKDPLNAR